MATFEYQTFKKFFMTKTILLTEIIQFYTVVPELNSQLQINGQTYKVFQDLDQMFSRHTAKVATSQNSRQLLY